MPNIFFKRGKSLQLGADPRGAAARVYGVEGGSVSEFLG
jgi:hypothetical protein